MRVGHAANAAVGQPVTNIRNRRSGNCPLRLHRVNNVITFSKTYTGSSYEMTASAAILPEACLIRALFAASA